jgi:hypothetical protein
MRQTTRPTRRSSPPQGQRVAAASASRRRWRSVPSSSRTSGGVENIIQLGARRVLKSIPGSARHAHADVAQAARRAPPPYAGKDTRERGNPREKPEAFPVVSAVRSRSRDHGRAARVAFRRGRQVVRAVHRTGRFRRARARARARAYYIFLPPSRFIRRLVALRHPGPRTAARAPARVRPRLRMRI